MPIKLVIEEDEIENEKVEVIEKFSPDNFESLIPDDALVVNVKWNVPVLELDEVRAKIIFDFPLRNLFSYLDFCNVKILFSSMGFHVNGDARIPHVHLNFICNSLDEKSYKAITQNSSQHRTRWFEKNGSQDQFKFLTFKWHKTIDKTKPKYSTLSYPLKEGHSLIAEFPDAYKNISPEVFEYLKSVGQSIYNQELGLHLRQNKCEERKKNSLLELFELCEKNKNKFSTFHGMLLWLDDNYISTLTIADYPDPKNYKTNCQKIAVKLGFIKYSNLCV